MVPEVWSPFFFKGSEVWALGFDRVDEGFYAGPLLLL